MICQWFDVLRTFPQWGQMNLETVDPIEQVGAKRSIADDSIEILIRGGNDAHVDFDFAHAANAEKCARFDRAQ